MSRRSYRQYCSFARAMDVLGDRWTLLIVRNLLLGAQTWSELREGLPGVAKNLLSERLKHLAEDDVLVHRDGVYELTERGRELEPIVFALANWGERHFMGPPDEEDAFRVRYLMTSVRRRLGRTNDEYTIQLYLDASAFWIRTGGEPIVEQGENTADVVVRSTMRGFRALLFDRARVTDLVDAGVMEVAGPVAALEELRGGLRRAT